MPGYCAVCSRIRLIRALPFRKEQKFPLLSRHSFITLLRQTSRYLAISKDLLLKVSTVQGVFCCLKSSYTFVVEFHTWCSQGRVIKSQPACLESEMVHDRDHKGLVLCSYTLLQLGWWVPFRMPALLTRTRPYFRHSPGIALILTYLFWRKCFFPRLCSLSWHLVVSILIIPPLSALDSFCPDLVRSVSGHSDISQWCLW